VEASADALLGLKNSAVGTLGEGGREGGREGGISSVETYAAPLGLASFLFCVSLIAK
jgi:hypothetical protein